MEDEEFIIFYTGIRAFKYKVLLFNFINSPANFQTFINLILSEYLKNFYITYIDNILIYLNIFEEYKIYVKTVFAKLKNVGL